VGWERVPTPFWTIVTFLEDLDFSFQLLRIGIARTEGDFCV